MSHIRPASRRAAAGLLLIIAARAAASPLDRFQEQGELHGFACRHLYLDSQGRTAGACLVHESGFTVDLLPLETAPQAFVWIATPVSGHQGEPHTLEHLLLGKGRRGLSVANAEEFRLSSSTAFTGQLETCYHFSTALGEEAFLTEFGDRLDALLHPDFSDEEIRREVCHVGPKSGPAGLELEEKGTVYTEMLSSWDNGWSRASHRLNAALFGADHPQAAYQGGIPAEIRRLTPRDIRDFQRESHFLGNMGVELVLPAGGMNEPLLAKLDSLLRRVEPERPDFSTRTRGDLPPLRPAAGLLTEVVDAPGAREGEPALLLAAWPPTRKLARPDFLFAQLFLSVAGSGESSDLYHELIDPAHAADPLGAAWLSMWIEDAPGQAVWLGMGSLPPSRVTVAGLTEIRARILARLGEISAWRAGEPQLESLKERALALLASQRRQGRGLLDHPPGFGQRGTSSFWADHLRNLRATGEFRLRLDEEPALADIEQRLQRAGNPFSALLDQLGLLKTPPHVVGTRSNPALLEQKESERLARLEAFADSLETAYGVTDRQEALRRFAADYDQVSAELEAQRAGLPVPELPATLPLDYDPEILTEEHTLAGGVPLLHGVFEGMQGARFDLAFDVGPLAGLPWLSALPALLTQSGLRGATDTLDFRQVEDALRREVSWAGCWLDTDLEAGRAELVFTSVGTSAEECRTGIRWLERFLTDADWSAANRPRLREIVRRELSGLRETRKGSEESWVEIPAAAWPQRRQPGLLRAGCFLTQEHDLFRCAWALQDLPPAARDLLRGLARLPEQWPGRPDSCLAWTRGLLEAPADGRARYLIRLDPNFSSSALDAATWQVLELAVRDLAAFGAELPAESFAADWARLARELTDSAELLTQLDLRLVNRCGRRRAWFTGSRAAWDQVRPLAASVAERRVDPAEREQKVDRSAMILTGLQVRTRLLGVDQPETCRGLLDPGSSSGVVIASAPLTWQHAWTREDLLNHLAGNLLGGGSDQGLFMQTWAAGLAYSNGIRPRERTGVLRYYAERCPDLSQTLSFVEERVRQAPPVDAARTRTALITALGGSRTALDYDERTRQRALELQLVEWVDEYGRHTGPFSGKTTRLDDLRGFRRGLIGLLDDPQLPAELEARKLAVHARVFPGLAEGGWLPLPGTQFFIIGPERQFELADDYLAARAPGHALRRLRPRDYWLVEEK
ncbi:MAG: hypothetical protein WC326_12795 [Candidatus Delongbacteria bacterium]